MSEPPKILQVYKDPQLTSRNPATLAKRAGVTLAAAKSFLRDREEAQVGKERRASKKQRSYQQVMSAVCGSAIPYI